jgi:hypothetical protein
MEHAEPSTSAVVETANARLERPRHSELRAGGRSHERDDMSAIGHLPSSWPLASLLPR